MGNCNVKDQVDYELRGALPSSVPPLPQSEAEGSRPREPQARIRRRRFSRSSTPRPQRQRGTPTPQPPPQQQQQRLPATPISRQQSSTPQASSSQQQSSSPQHPQRSTIPAPSSQQDPGHLLPRRHVEGCRCQKCRPDYYHLTGALKSLRQFCNDSCVEGCECPRCQERSPSEASGSENRGSGDGMAHQGRYDKPPRAPVRPDRSNSSTRTQHLDPGLESLASQERQRLNLSYRYL